MEKPARTGSSAALGDDLRRHEAGSSSSRGGGESGGGEYSVARDGGDRRPSQTDSSRGMMSESNRLGLVERSQRYRGLGNRAFERAQRRCRSPERSSESRPDYSKIPTRGRSPESDREREDARNLRKRRRSPPETNPRSSEDTRAWKSYHRSTSMCLVTRILKVIFYVRLLQASDDCCHDILKWTKSHIADDKSLLVEIQSDHNRESYLFAEGKLTCSIENNNNSLSIGTEREALNFLVQVFTPSKPVLELERRVMVSSGGTLIKRFKVNDNRSLRDVASSCHSSDLQVQDLITDRESKAFEIIRNKNFLHARMPAYGQRSLVMHALLQYPVEAVVMEEFNALDKVGQRAEKLNLTNIPFTTKVFNTPGLVKRNTQQRSESYFTGEIGVASVVTCSTKDGGEGAHWLGTLGELNGMLFFIAGSSPIGFNPYVQALKDSIVVEKKTRPSTREELLLLLYSKRLREASLMIGT